MKKYFLLAITALLLTATSAFSQLRKIPAEVTEAFKNKYPEAKDVSWSDNLTSFQASFTLFDEKLDASFNSKGEWKKTEKNLVIADIPASVMEGYKASKYGADWAVKSAHETEQADGKFEYRLTVEKSALQKKYIYLNRDGQILKETITL